MAMKSPVHPGSIVRHDCLEPLGLSVTDAAKALGVNRTTLSKLVSQRAGISPDMAIRLEKAGFSSADLWLRLQAGFDLARARQHEDEITVLRIDREPIGIQ